MAHTQHPVVLIHGVFGYGSQRPFWNQWAPYWPQRALDAMDANYRMVDVGVLSSDHDRACEAFFQLYGGRVDYGEAHARLHGHARYGYTHAVAQHPNWSEDNPVHLVGHSFGATTAIELYQLLCQDYFGVGSNHKWVKSIVSIAGPLSGTTLTHLFGLHDGKMVAFTLGHAIGAALCVWQTLHVQFPALRRLFDYRMPQWEHVASYREALSSTCRILASYDLAVYDILPARRLARNSRLVEMDKPFLVSIATSAHAEVPVVEISLAMLLAVLIGVVAGGLWYHRYEVATSSALLAVAAAVVLLGRLRDLDYATVPCLTFLRVQMSWCVRWLHEIFDGFERDEWEPNDGAVNLASMLTPLQFRPHGQEEEVEEDGTSEDASGSDTDTSGSDAGSTASTVVLPTGQSALATASQPLLTTHKLHLDLYGRDDHEPLKKKKALLPGRWYIHQLRKNHMAGTHFDRDAPQLFRQLLYLLATEAES